MKSLRLHDKDFIPYISQAEIEQKVADLAAEIDKDYNQKNPLLIVVLNGAFRFGGDLVKNLHIPLEMAFIKVSSYEGIESSGKIKEVLGLDADINGREIIIVEDIVDTGLTIRRLYKDLEKFKPASIAVATLLLKPEALQFEPDLKYIGFRIPLNFVVGYGLDYEQKGRELNDIYVLA